MSKILIRKFKPQDADVVCKMVRKTFLMFVGYECTQAGAKKWLSFNTPSRQIERAKSRAVFVATADRKIVGMVEIAPNRVSRLFVDSKFHGQGIGKKLMRQALAIFIKRKSKTVKANSSSYSVPFYQKMRFRRTGRKIRWKGIPFNPMKLRLK